MVSWSMLPLAPADAEPEADLPLDDADLSLDDADLSLDDADLSLDEDEPLAAGELELPEDDPLAAGELELPDAPPEVAPCELEVDGWLAEEPLLLCVSCFCCATAPNDSNAAATATAIALIFMNISFPGGKLGAATWIQGASAVPIGPCQESPGKDFAYRGSLHST